MFIDTEADGPSGTGRMIVDPTKLTQLKNGIDEEATRVRDWLEANIERLTSIDPPGNDPCSRDTMGVMGQTGQSAIDKSQAYISRLTMAAEKLHESAVAYGVTEDNNATAFRQDPR